MQLTTMQIAARCNKSERQVQRWITTGKLKALHIDGRLYEVSEDDLQPFLPHEVVDSLSERISALEDRIHTLEGLVSQLTTPTPTRHLTAPRATYAQKTTSEHDTLPEGLVPLAEFYHGIPETTVRRSLTSGVLPVQRGTWKKQGHAVNLALDAPGQAAFYVLYHEHPHFIPCEDCPHHEL